MFIPISICFLIGTSLLSKHESTQYNQVQVFIIIIYFVSSDDIWGVIKMSVTPVMGFHTMKLVVEFEPVSDAIGYDPCPDSFPASSNPVSVDVPA
jgi:hypothetical protein